MIRPLVQRRVSLWLLLSLSVFVSRMRGQDNESALSLTRMREEVLRMSEFFGNDLPGTLRRFNMTLDFTPKFSDVRSRKFVRYPFEIRYGITDNWELFGGMSPFTPNPFNNGLDHRWGLGEASFGARYDLGHPPLFYDEATIGEETRIPLGRPPYDLNDGYTHVRPFLSAARKLTIVRHTTFYTNYSYDHEFSTPTRRDPPHINKRNVLEVAPAFMYKPGEFGEFVDYAFRFFHDPGNDHLGHEIQVGVLWDVKLERTQKWNLPGKWQVEFAYKVTTEQGFPNDRGFSVRVRWKTTLRQVLNWDTKPKDQTK